MSHLTVSDLMTEDVIPLSERDDLATAYDLMDSNNVRHLPVVNRNRELIGLISHRDVMRELFTQSQDLPLSNQRDFLRAQKVSEVMVEEIETITADEDIQEAGRIMMENKISCLPVVSGSQLIGILTEEDFVKFVVDHAEIAPRSRAVG